MRNKNILQLLGPGLLFAGAAVGVSHLVYSTKAGATYGFGLVWLIIIANLLKYPFFEFGPRYAAATGESLLRGYQRLGNWVLGLFGLITIGTMFTIIAAVTIVTASLAASLFGITSNLMIWVVMILIVCASILGLGRYSLLDNLMKIIIVSLTIITLITVVIAFSQTTEPISWTQTFPMESAGLTFIIAFMGWMPAPLDLSVWHSLWGLEKQEQSEGAFNMKQSLFDFNVGYIGTTILALFFVALGALVMYNSGQEFSPKGAVFAKQLIELYTSTLGESMGLFIGLAAFITMFSTTITCLDALPRSMAKAHTLLTDAKSPTTTIPDIADTDAEILDNNTNQSIKSIALLSKQYYFGWMAVIIIGALIILNLFLTNMATFLMIATILSFLTAPFFAIANYILVFRYLPIAQQPSNAIKVLSWIGIAYLFVFCGIYIGNL